VLFLVDVYSLFGFTEPRFRFTNATMRNAHGQDATDRIEAIRRTILSVSESVVAEG
jgi:hypothetical protein